jgi:hypothetical protein
LAIELYKYLMKYDPVFTKSLFDTVYPSYSSSPLQIRSSWIMLSHDAGIYHNYSAPATNGGSIYSEEENGSNDGFSLLELERLLELKYRNDEKLKNRVIFLRLQLAATGKSASTAVNGDNNDSNKASSLSLVEQLQLQTFAKIK